MAQPPTVSEEYIEAIYDDFMDKEMVKPSSKLKISDLCGEIHGKKVLIRVDFNFPVKDSITDPSNIAPTI
jgi:hypothetical protein